jgi:hypothetical protein
MNHLQTYKGHEIIIYDYGEGASVKRSWKERLFSRPWNPFKRTKYNPYGGKKFIEDGEVIVDSNINKLYMNSKTYDEFTKEIAKEREE